MIKRKYVYAVGTLFLLFIVLSLYATTSRSKNKIFTGIDGKTVTVRGNFPKQKNSSNLEGIPKVGTVIKEEDNTEEVVFAINTDGSYITIPLEYYEEMTRSTEDNQ